MIGSPDKPFP
uniref:Uncharacterized protein n=1 Tax=Nymphaea colorata TaxID=210225 RepID=A0A5K0WZT9_9MAGN